MTRRIILHVIDLLCHLSTLQLLSSAVLQVNAFSRPSWALGHRRTHPETPHFISSAPFETSDRVSWDENNSNHKSNKYPSLLTPYQVLYPQMFPADDLNVTGYDVQKPLWAVLRLFREALEQIIEKDDLDSPHAIIRIEHVLSNAVDPLAWMHAQQCNSYHNHRQGSTQNSAAFYFNANPIEVAALGAAVTLSETSHILQYALPTNGQWYGGERFDPIADYDINRTVAPEWRDFGNSAFWMIPIVELRVLNDVSTLALHLVQDDKMSFRSSAKQALQVLQQLSDRTSPAAPTTTLPPVLSRDSNYDNAADGQDLYERGVAEALEALQQGLMQKVVLARKQKMHFGVEFSALDVLRRWKYGGHEGGHLFFVRPAADAEFFGCTPERLFRVRDGKVQSEALAGTRPRGSTQQADEELLRDLFESPKDRKENLLTGQYIQQALVELKQEGLVNYQNDDNTTLLSSSGMFVRRLLHLQHICQHFSADLSRPESVLDVSHRLLNKLHPTPAVCGMPMLQSREFIRQHEAIGFDRGYYAGPIGYIGNEASDIVVGIRSGLVSRNIQDGTTTLSIYAGAGIVPGSTIQGEWSETNYKFGVISSVFPQAPITLQSAPTPNVAWATAFIEELIRNGVTRFYVCPGSRSTPLVVAISRAARSNVGVVHAVSVHDERAAAFRALGYGRGRGRPAAVITSSGTAVANLYPAVVEAGMDGVPLLLLTADRPYESRDSGANQAIDQMKMFSSSYVRWFRDILPPTDDIPVAVALSDASHAVSVARKLRGPVHINMQFRENLAPDAGQIRSDRRAGSVVVFNGGRFTDTPRFKQWSMSGRRWTNDPFAYERLMAHEDVQKIANLIRNSKRGLIVVGNLRLSAAGSAGNDMSTISDLISEFAKEIGFPIFAGAQSAGLRFTSTAVVPFAEHLLKSPIVAENLCPDLVFQIGAPLISTEIPSIISSVFENAADSPVHHVLLHASAQTERADPSFTVTHSVESEVAPFLKSLLDTLKNSGHSCSSELAPLVSLGRRLREKMRTIIHEESKKVSQQANGPALTEPEIVVALSDCFSEGKTSRSLFMSNSMPIRDSDFFLYPFSDCVAPQLGPKDIGTNRGASGIDGIISSAFGFAEATEHPTTLLIGDLATLHDLNSFHSLANDLQANIQTPNRKTHPLTTVVVNNDGGGIFSFLPIAQHGASVSFNEMFGTPTSSFSFDKGIGAFGLDVEQVYDYQSFVNVLSKTSRFEKHSVIEALVVGREQNVRVHRGITQRVQSFVSNMLEFGPNLHGKRVGNKLFQRDSQHKKVLLLLHGWMGDSTEWSDVRISLEDRFQDEWEIIALDLPGHGSSDANQMITDIESIRTALNLDKARRDNLSIDNMADIVLQTLSTDGVNKVHAIAGYSLGGRVALSMLRLASTEGNTVIDDETRVILLGSFPGLVSPELEAEWIQTSSKRLQYDDLTSKRIHSTFRKSFLFSQEQSYDRIMWSQFLSSWYGSKMWGALKESGPVFSDMLSKRSVSLGLRGSDLAASLLGCSPPKNKVDDFRFASAERVLFLAGNLDSKYKSIGASWKEYSGVNFETIEGAGHALLVEKPQEVAQAIESFLQNNRVMVEEHNAAERKAFDTVLSNVIEEPNASHDRVQVGTVRKALNMLRYRHFSIGVGSGSTSSKSSIKGIGWGEKAAASNELSSRNGFIIELSSDDDIDVGLGEVSPLKGLHSESLEDAEKQLSSLQRYFEHNGLGINANAVLTLDGSLNCVVRNLESSAGIALLPSVKAGIEMAILSIASQRISRPIHLALGSFAATGNALKGSGLPLNGLFTRVTRREERSVARLSRSFYSIKVKAGHQGLDADCSDILDAFQTLEVKLGRGSGKIRVDANRAWNYSQAIEFASALDGIKTNAAERVEFVEEPLQVQLRSEGPWTLRIQIEALERWYRHTGIRYALDETIADLVREHSGSLPAIAETLVDAFSGRTRGCAAFVLKPSLLGLELSYQLAKLARTKLGIGAVFSSSFDSGLGLAYTAFLGSASDQLTSTAPMFAHGVGTFTMLASDTIVPSFGSYVNDKGYLNIPSLSRALYGLRIDEITNSASQSTNEDIAVIGDFTMEFEDDHVEERFEKTASSEYEASTATSSTGKEISVVVSLPLPFSAEIACSRFTDLPQQSRWSPWIASVAYQGAETEWTVNVRGIPLKWRATSEILADPYPGIQWESTSGLGNRGIVEFVPESEDKCHMNVRMTILIPRLLRPVFQGTSLFVEDFLRDKLLKWSLEMFRDVVKADLALERGEVELGDALFGAVEGKASAIEATLNMTRPIPTED